MPVYVKKHGMIIVLNVTAEFPYTQSGLLVQLTLDLDYIAILLRLLLQEMEMSFAVGIRQFALLLTKCHSLSDSIIFTPY